MTNEHLTAREARSYQERKLSPSDLIRLTDHIAACEKCRQRLSGNPTETNARQIRMALLGIRGGRATDHPDDDELAAHVDGILDPLKAESLASHLEECAACAADARDLQSLRAGGEATSAAPIGRPAVRVARALAVAAGLAAATVTGVWLLWRERSGIERPPARLSVGEPTAESPRMVLHDASGVIVQRVDGQWTGWPPQPSAVDEAVHRVLVSQALEIPADVLDLRRTHSNLRSASAGSPSFLLTPVGVVVEEDRPALRWRSMPGARHYVVTVSNERGGALVKSPPLSTTEWAPPPLSRGKTYLWEVTAHTASGATTAPQPPAPEARFRVLDRASLEALREARRSPSRSHLVLGVVYARAGLLEDAERELQALATLNPNASLPDRLLADLRRRRPQKAVPTTENAAQ